jgi:hypothetical protein
MALLRVQGRRCTLTGSLRAQRAKSWKKSSLQL